MFKVRFLMRWNALKGHDMADAHRCTPLRKVVLDLFNIREVQHKCNNSNLRDWEIQVQVYIIFFRSVLIKWGNYYLSSQQISIAFTGWILRIKFYDTFIVSLCHICWWWRLAWENWVNIRANIYCDQECIVQCVIVATITHSLPNELDSDEIIVIVQ